MRLLQIAIAAGCSMLLFSCANPNPSLADNQLTDQERSDGWVSLFDGKTTKGWHLYNKGNIPSSWSVRDGELTCSTDPKTQHGDLLTDKQYENYDFKFDWKITPKGNSGVFINVVERQDLPTAWASGPEYQLLDSAHPDYAIPLKRSGAIFGLDGRLNPVDDKAAGEWNHSEIKQFDGKIEFYLNGVLTVKEDFNSQLWKDSISHTHFREYPEFGKHTRGFIALQDWYKGVSFKNLKIKGLAVDSVNPTSVAPASNAPTTAASPHLDDRWLELVGKNGCLTCHQVDTKVIGPAYIDVAAKYENTPANVKMLATKIIKGGSGVWGNIPMTAHPDLSQADAEEMVRYILQFKKK